MVSCRLCGKDGVKLVKAHVIPRSMYGDALKDPTGPAKLITNAEGQHDRRSPVGIYDSNIVCTQCETLFSPWDNYAHELFFKKEADEKIVHNGEVLGFRYAAPDYLRLKLFFVSLLWRAHWCSDKFFSGVDIGPYEKIARKMILNGDPRDPETFAVVLARFHDDQHGGFLHPFRERYDNVSVYRFFFSRHVAYIKVDKQRTAATFRQAVLKPETDLLIFARELSGSNELDVMRKLVQGRI